MRVIIAIPSLAEITMSGIKEILPKFGVNLLKMIYLIGKFQVVRVTALVSDFNEITFQLAVSKIKHLLINVNEF